MTQEALKLALKVLEDCVNSYGMKYDRPTFVKTITAIKEALAQEKTLQTLHSENERLGLYKDAYAEQEPVAWAVYCDGFIALPAFDTKQDALKEMQRRNKKWPHNKREVKALYDAPPQRTWVGMTDEDISKISQRFGIDHDDSWTDLKQAIEAKLKEKNT